MSDIIAHAHSAFCPKTFIATGAAAATNITVTGIEVGDKIFTALDLTAQADGLLAEVSITAADTIQFASTSTATHKVLIQYHDVSA